MIYAGYWTRERGLLIRLVLLMYKLWRYSGKEGSAAGFSAAGFDGYDRDCIDRMYILLWCFFLAVGFLFGLDARL